MLTSTMEVRTDLRPGDLGAIIRLHGLVYADEQGFDHTFEGYVARGVAEWAARRDPERDRVWLVEEGGELLGSIAIIRPGDDGTPGDAQLRWLLLHPRLRGRGVGRRLVGDAIGFARDRGYRGIFLLTIEGLPAAAHLYTEAGFRLVASEPREAWGQRVVAETYRLEL